MRHPLSVIAAVLVQALGLASAARGQEISPTGMKLAKFLDDMNVEKLWLAKAYVNWETGAAIDKPVEDKKPHTHCSAFVAAACKRLDIYILRPPKHGQYMLANAQYDWLAKEGEKEGWLPVKSAAEAQKLANQGDLVVAVFKEKDPTKHGHIAIVRPGTKSAKEIKEAGPQIIQAGLENYNSTSLKEGFKHHPSAFSEGQVRYYVHRVVWQQ
jgi:hypothetical protein